MAQLKSVSEVIDAFGGIVGCQTVFGGVPGRFYNYKAAGGFPPYMHMRIYVECVKRGLPIAPELVGMTEDEMALAKGECQREFPLQAAE